MVGVHQFSGLSSMLAAGSTILLLSDQTTNPSVKKRRFVSFVKNWNGKLPVLKGFLTFFCFASKKTRGKGVTKDWTLHVLKAMDLADLYHKMVGIIDFSHVHSVYREYYMVARKYEIYFECEQDISRVRAANECDVLFKTRNKFHIFRPTM